MALQGVRKFPVRVKCETLAWVELDQGVEEFETSHAKVAAKATSEAKP